MGEVERINATFSASLTHQNHHRVDQAPQRNPRKHQEQSSQDDVLELHSDEDSAPMQTVLPQIDSSEELDLSA